MAGESTANEESRLKNDESKRQQAEQFKQYTGMSFDKCLERYFGKKEKPEKRY